MYYIDVILPIPLKQTFTYSVNKDEAAFLKQGYRVAVPFGKSKVYTAIVYQVHDQAPQGYETKAIDQILDETPIITPLQIQHWEWMASYYLCTLGEVVRAALPSAYLLESETIIKLAIETHSDTALQHIENTFTDDEFLVIEALQVQPTLHINDIRAVLNNSKVVKTLEQLRDKKCIEVVEQVVEKYTPKLRRYVKLTQGFSTEEALHNLLEEMARAPKQKEVLMTLFLLQQQTKKPVDAIQLQKRSGATAATINKLLDKGILEEYYVQKDRVNYEGQAAVGIKSLSPAQEKAYDEINASFEQNSVVLLHGVTASGKTEVYVKVIEQLLLQQKQVLYMLPEIALTTQLIKRLQVYFGEHVSVFHSRYTVAERVEVWNNVLNNQKKAQIIIGARSSLFLPFSNLGCIVIDEEHEASYKQNNPAPRYQARDAAIVLAHLHKAKVLLGSATPSLESYYNAIHNKYSLVLLKERYGKVLLPEISLIDIKEKYKKKLMKGHFSDTLLQAIKETLSNGEQVLLFQNRRGYAPVVECTTCGVSPQCANCDVSLTFHQYKNELRCHYCGFHQEMTISCMACGSETLNKKGLGTQQIETELKALFPDYKIARMDQDTTRGKHAHAKLIDKLENLEIDVIVGTQMLAKGLDFRNVRLVGVMNADNLLNIPDFRAHEKAFQLLQQVSGRAGRTKERGKVLIQTYNPLHQILQQVTTNSYEAMYKDQKEDRYHYKYPPFYRLIKITCKDQNFDKVTTAAQWYAASLATKLKENILGPEPPPVSRIRNKFITHILVKIPKEQSLTKTKKYIENVQRTFNSIHQFSTVRVTLDVDNH